MQILEDLDKMKARFFMCQWIISFIIYFEKIGYRNDFESFRMIENYNHYIKH